MLYWVTLTVVTAATALPAALLGTYLGIRWALPHYIKQFPSMLSRPENQILMRDAMKTWYRKCGGKQLATSMGVTASKAMTKQTKADVKKSAELISQKVMGKLGSWEKNLNQKLKKKDPESAMGGLGKLIELLSAPQANDGTVELPLGHLLGG